MKITKDRHYKRWILRKMDITKEEHYKREIITKDERLQKRKALLMEGRWKHLAP